MGAGGVIVPPKGYFKRIAAICTKYDIYMISDEVICGFGRLGTMFGAQALGFRPDGVSVAKALSSGYVPIAAVLVPEVMYEALLTESRKIGTFGHGFTYSGHPVAAAVALKTLEIYRRDGVVAKVAEKTPRFQERLRALGSHPLVGEARGMGLIGAIELVSDRRTKRAFEPVHGVGPRCARFAEENGLIVRAIAGDVISICPPLVITMEEIDMLFDRLNRAIDQTLAWATQENLVSHN
jgi:4-aminobutyrate---pyruvate transaminase